MTWLLLVFLVCTTTISGGEGDCSLYNANIEKCQAGVICRNSTSDLVTTITNWGCGRTEQYNCENHFDYDYQRYETICQTRFVYDFKLILNIHAINLDTVPWTKSEKSIETHIIELVITNNVISNIPRRVYIFSNVNKITMISNIIESVQFNDFLELAHLTNITLPHNSIKVLESKEITTKSNSVNYIDLSYNLIESIPNNYFKYYSQLKSLNLANNLIKNFQILTFEGISQLEVLTLSNNHILEIGQTLVRFVKLKELLLDHNNLTSIEENNFSTMEMLEKLDLDSNQLNNINKESFKNLVSLESLSLNLNLLSDMSINLQNTALKNLDISNNRIEHIASKVFKGKNITQFVMNNNNLIGVMERNTFDGIYTDVLDLSGYKIISLDPEAFTGLHVRVLNLSSNAINTISSTSFKSVIFLHELDLSNNCLSSIDFDTSDLNELILLNLRNNSIEHIARIMFKDLISLKKLDLSLNKIVTIKYQVFLSLQKLEFLYISNNNISNTLKSHIFQGLSNIKEMHIDNLQIASIENETFSGLNALKTLNVSNNEIDNLNYEVFKNTGSIEVLDLSHNLLQQFLINTSNIISIQVLHLDNNKIFNITNETFFGLINLHTLYLNNNNIMKLNAESLVFLNNLNVLDLSYNKAMELGDDFHNLMSLTKLSLTNVETQISFEHIVTSLIETLDLSSSGIVSINSIHVYKNKNVQSLTLKANKIMSIDKFSFKSMPCLTYLDLSFNLISFIQPGTFLNTNHIKYLNMHDNRLRSLQFGVLDGLNELDRLNLSSNLLVTFEKNILHNTPAVTLLSLDENDIEVFKFEDFIGTSLKTISLGNNPISCNAFVNLKQIKLTFVVTAENIDYHNENVDGVKCKSSRASTNFTFPVNNVTDVNSTVALFAFSHALENFRSSLTEVVKNFSLSMDKINNNNLASTLQQKTESNTMTNILEQMYAMNNNYNKTQTALYKYLNELSVTNNHTMFIEEYLKKITGSENEHIILRDGNMNDKNVLDDNLQEKIRMLNYEKEKMINEMKTIFQNFKNSSNTRKDALINDTNDSSGIKPLIYFIAVCLCAMLVMSGLFFYSSYKKSRSNFEKHCSSAQPIVNGIELYEQ
ncbi:toll-like receptor 3 isoform X2 [Pectinophora gossypiella]|nr:toll-like receptor 3 isoform X2 [Pectinophora gossypiella]XP_049876789.1 toll-like receptor 3 isoform X2 [Pectinophora gossypiella]